MMLSVIKFKGLPEDINNKIHEYIEYYPRNYYLYTVDENYIYIRLYRECIFKSNHIIRKVCKYRYYIPERKMTFIERNYELKDNSGKYIIVISRFNGNIYKQYKTQCSDNSFRLITYCNELKTGTTFFDKNYGNLSVDYIYDTEDNIIYNCIYRFDNKGWLKQLLKVNKQV